MSSDNGIYTLKTPTSDGKSFEYRVIHAQAIDNIFRNPDDAYAERENIGNPESVISYTGVSI